VRRGTCGVHAWSSGVDATWCDGKVDEVRHLRASACGATQPEFSKLFDAHPDLIPTGGTDWVHTPQ